MPKMLIHVSEEEGFASRVRTSLSLYNCARKIGAEFRIHQKHPCRLSRFLDCGSYDWRLSDESYEEYLKSWNRKPLTLYVSDKDLNDEKIASFENDYVFASMYESRDVWNGAKFRQMHSELFKLTPWMQDITERQLKMIGGDFISCSFRFSNNLGGILHDIDYHIKPMDSSGQESIIKQAMSHLEFVHGLHPDSRIFVSSDSLAWYERIKGLPYVHVADCSQFSMSDGEKWMLKSVSEFYILGESRRIYQILDKSFNVYTVGHEETQHVSQFPLLAGLRKDVPVTQLFYEGDKHWERAWEGLSI